MIARNMVVQNLFMPLPIERDSYRLSTGKLTQFGGVGIVPVLPSWFSS
jgi:hypothetical protein